MIAITPGMKQPIYKEDFQDENDEIHLF